MMKLYIMKQSAVDYLKENMRTYYINYYRKEDNDWILKLFDYDPFELFMEVPEFKLAPYMEKKGEMDLENCKIMYTNLMRISESQASDERLWAGLCNSTFYKYCRMRWDYPSKKLKNIESDADAILSRFFFKGTYRSGFYRNTLAKCWWVGHGTYQEIHGNKFELLDALGVDDLSTKITDLFYSNTFASNPTIIKGICKGWKIFTDRGIKLTTREYFRPALQYMNALGGGILLDMLDADEIRDVFVDYILQLYNKDKEESAFANADDSYDDIDDEEDIEEENADIVYMQESNDTEEMEERQNEKFGEGIETVGISQTKDIKEAQMLNKLMGKPKEITFGCSVILHIIEENRDVKYDVPKEKNGQGWYDIYNHMLGKSIGESFKLRIKTYIITEISW